MAMGYCRVCDKLVTIRLAPSDWEDGKPLDEVRLGQTRAAVWKPVMHDGPDGKRCPGERKAI